MNLIVQGIIGAFQKSPGKFFQRWRTRFHTHEPKPSPGARLGRYEINTLLGAGGMGEVYFADTEMDRTVAIKILPPALGLGPTAIAALHPESESTWALNHPPSLAIHETGATGVSRLIATEFIDRDTLRQRLSARFKLVDSVRIRFASVRLVNFR